jgi:hypothetical protein
MLNSREGGDREKILEQNNLVKEGADHSSNTGSRQGDRSSTDNNDTNK